MGRVKEFFVSAEDGMEYLDVKTGALGLRSVLVPLRAVATEGEGRTVVLRRWPARARTEARVHGTGRPRRGNRRLC